MTVPSTGRERRLLKKEPSLFRGLSSSPNMSAAAEREKEDEDQVGFDQKTSNRFEEDVFLPGNVPACIGSLPRLLFDNCRTSRIQFPLIQPTQYHLMKRKREMQAMDNFNLLRSYFMLSDPSQQRTLFHHNEPELDVLLLDEVTETKDATIFLDYLPMLRNMAVAECITEYLYKVSENSPHNSNDQPITNRRRNTRRSKKLGRQHYFDQLGREFVWKDSEYTPSQVGAKLANASLIYHPTS